MEIENPAVDEGWEQGRTGHWGQLSQCDLDGDKDLGWGVVTVFTGG